jgi:hypothetical protein
MILIVVLILTFTLFFLFSLSKIRTSKEVGLKFPWKILAVVAGSALFLFTGLILYVVDYYSAKHWIEVVPIVDASSQDKGKTGFSLPSGDYLIQVDREGDVREDDSLTIRYVLDVPNEGLKIVQEKTLPFVLGLRQYDLESFVFKKDKSNGVISVEILKPSKSKIAVKLVTNRYFDM